MRHVRVRLSAVLAHRSSGSCSSKDASSTKRLFDHTGTNCKKRGHFDQASPRHQGASNRASPRSGRLLDQGTLSTATAPRSNNLGVLNGCAVHFGGWSTTSIFLKVRSVRKIIFFS